MEQLTIITGASSGIGAALAAQAEAAGHTVATVSRRPGPGEHLAADLSDPAVWSTTAEWMEDLIAGRSWDRIVFIHNAGTLEPVGFAGEVDSNAYMKNVLLNSASTQVLGDRFIPAAEGAGCPAQMQVISSGAGKRPIVGWSSYCAGKAAGDMWVRTAGMERSERSSSVALYAVGPGVVDTAMQAHIRDQNTDDFPNVERFQALKDEGALRSPDEVAAILLRLAATEPGETIGSVQLENGAVIDVDQLS